MCLYIGVIFLWVLIKENNPPEYDVLQPEVDFK